MREAELQFVFLNSLLFCIPSMSPSEQGCHDNDEEEQQTEPEDSPCNTERETPLEQQHTQQSPGRPKVSERSRAGIST